MRLLIAISYIIIGCGAVNKIDWLQNNKNSSKYTMNDHNEIFEQYMDGFPNRLYNIPIVFVDKMHNAGVCYGWSNGHREIEINKEMWDTFSENQKLWLIWHEMHHCVNNAGHSNDHISDSGKCNDDTKTYSCGLATPLSIMRWYLPMDFQILKMCNTPGIDAISGMFCNNVRD